MSSFRRNRKSGGLRQGPDQRQQSQQPAVHNFQTAGLSFDAAWELDFWGKFRRNIHAADAALLASIADYDDVLVTLVAEVGLTYVQIRTFERRIELAKVNVALQRQSLELAESRYRNGKVSQLDVTEARATLANTQASVPGLESSLRDAKLSLGVLLGRTPSELEQELAGGSGIPLAPAEVAIGVPADLLRRRPDVRAAERAAAFRSEQIGIATADLFPSIAIGGSFGYEASDADGLSLGNNLFDSGSKVWSIGPILSWPILNYGRIRNNIRVQDAAFQEAAVNYQNTVLQAAAEVESSLYGFLKSREQLAYLTESAENARQSLELSRIQYTEGETDFLRVDIAAANLTRQQDSQAAVEGLVAASLISAYKALGGGWELRRRTRVHPAGDGRGDAQPDQLGQHPRCTGLHRQDGPGIPAAGRYGRHLSCTAGGDRGRPRGQGIAMFSGAPSEVQILGLYFPPLFVAIAAGLLCAIVLARLLNRTDSAASSGIRRWPTPRCGCWQQHSSPCSSSAP